MNKKIYSLFFNKQIDCQKNEELNGSAKLTEEINNSNSNNLINSTSTSKLNNSSSLIKPAIDHLGNCSSSSNNNNTNNTNGCEQAADIAAVEANEESNDAEILPYGWEKVEDPEYGVFYIE